MHDIIEPFSLPRWIEARPGCVARVGEWAASLDGTKAFLGIGCGSVKKSGLLERVEKALEAETVGVTLFEGIEAEPRVETVDRGAQVARKAGCDIFIALGGGSVLDVVKIIAMLEANPGTAEDYQLQKLQWKNPCKPVIGIPTTAGTGSEATKVCVMTNPRLGVKKAAYSWEMVPTVVLLDGEATVPLPTGLTRETGLDALGQAVEGYLSTGGNPVTAAAGARAIKLVRENLPAAIRDGAGIDARQNMLMASFLSGVAIGAGVGLGHEMAMAVGSYCGLSHGLLVGVLTPFCLEANLGWADDKIAEIAFYFDCPPAQEKVSAARSGVEAFYQFNRMIDHPGSLGEAGVRKEDIPGILEASRLSTDIRTNPRPLDDDIRRRVLEAAISGEPFGQM
ncbi:MAG: iron-containing alcohol dehydrogenase [Gemmatimonadota bacterium]|nr:iron-containing alcohol dehydrogenase [Gemmatimonadota bacterium]